MVGLRSNAEIPDTVRYQRLAIEQIIQSVEQGTYCAVLGPRLSGKTVLLRFVEGILAESLGWTCIYIDLYRIQSPTLVGFFADLMRITAERLRECTGQPVAIPEDIIPSSAVFRGFLTDSVEQVGKDIVLIIEHLEVVPADLIQALLTSLRAAYMDQQTMDSRVIVVVSGALSLASLTVGESSPFRGIARRVFIGDLSEQDSEALILEYLTGKGVNVTNQARRRLLSATNGDPYLIRKISQRCVDRALATSSKRLGSGTVTRVTNEFLRDEVFEYAPLLEAIRLIEEDPELIHCVLMLLGEDIVHRGKLPLPLSPDLDPLYLTGVVERVDGDYYRVQNSIYHQFLDQYFSPGRVGHLLAMSGSWDSAIDYLEMGVQRGDERSRTDLLSAAVNSMYASEGLERAAHFLTRGLSAAFGVGDAQVWILPPQEKSLLLVGSSGNTSNSALWSNPQISINADQLEARAFRQSVSMRGQESSGRVQRAIPLMIPGSRPVGVVTVVEELGSREHRKVREHDLQLTGYLHQAARAIQTVNQRRQELRLAGKMQASLMAGSKPDVAGWQLAPALIPARETSGDFYDFIQLPNRRIGIVIADVEDKGIGAALYMTLSRTLIRTYAPENPNRPDITMRAVNERILADTEEGLFVTVFYGILEPASGVLTYCNAGHNPPFLFSEDYDGNVTALSKTGMALGVTYDSRWEPEVVKIPVRGTLFLYTDGVVDAQNQGGDHFGEERLLGAIRPHQDRSAREVQQAVINGVREFVGEEGQFDDITLVVVKREESVPVQKTQKMQRTKRVF